MAELTQNQQWLLNKVKLTSKKRAHLTVQRAKLNAYQKRRLRQAKQKLESSKIVVNINLLQQFHNEQLIDNLLRIGRTINLFEIGYFPGGVQDLDFRSRLMVEFKLYGATCNLQTIFSHMPDSERPNYGGLDYTHTQKAVDSLRLYGHHRFILNNEAKKRSTFTPYDSVMVERNQVFVWDDIEGVLATKLKDKFWYEYILSETEPLSVREGLLYIEAQILGGVHLSDIEKVYYPLGDEHNPTFFAKLRRFELDHGIPIIHY